MIPEQNDDLVYGEGFRCHCGQVMLHQEAREGLNTSMGVHHRILERCYMRDHLGLLYRRRNLYAPQA
jgi:hypothetical protein